MTRDNIYYDELSDTWEFSSDELDKFEKQIRQEAEKEYLLNTYGLTIKIANAEKQRIRTEAIDEAIAYFEIHAHEVYNHVSARDFICDRLEQLKEQKR